MLKFLTKREERWLKLQYLFVSVLFLRGLEPLGGFVLKLRIRKVLRVKHLIIPGSQEEKVAECSDFGMVPVRTFKNEWDLDRWKSEEFFLGFLHHEVGIPIWFVLHCVAWCLPYAARLSINIHMVLCASFLVKGLNQEKWHWFSAGVLPDSDAMSMKWMLMSPLDNSGGQGA